ncbi:MAG: hypothetical protein ACP5D2_02450, partial [Candidatus Nanoarchaeia archaeon]
VYWVDLADEYITIKPKPLQITSRNRNIMIEIGASRETRGNENVVVEARGSIVTRGRRASVDVDLDDMQTTLFDFIRANDFSNTKQMAAHLTDEIIKVGRRVLPTNMGVRDFEGVLEFKDPLTKNVRRRYKR